MHYIPVGKGVPHTNSPFIWSSDKYRTCWVGNDGNSYLISMWSTECVYMLFFLQIIYLIQHKKKRRIYLQISVGCIYVCVYAHILYYSLSYECPYQCEPPYGNGNEMAMTNVGKMLVKHVVCQFSSHGNRMKMANSPHLRRYTYFKNIKSNEKTNLWHTGEQMKH